MSEADRQVRTPYRRKTQQQGMAAVEFALIAVAFLTLLFGIIEIARFMFLVNTLAEVTSRAARAASNTDFTRTIELDQVRQRAMFRDTPGGMVLMPKLTDESIRIDYLSIHRWDDGTLHLVPIEATSLPSSPAGNRKVCLVDPNSPTCIRIVRVRICDASVSASCERVQYQSLVPLLNLPLPLPVSATLVKAESLGL